MSSLQKFHRRTMSLVSGPATWPPSAIGGGDVANGFWLGDGYFNALIVAPKSTEARMGWGSPTTARGTINTTNGLANTNTLYAFGSAAHPAAYYAKTQTTGGYNTWYLPAKNELTTLYSNKSATPFATANSFVVIPHWSSTEGPAGEMSRFCYTISYGDGNTDFQPKDGNYYCRAARRVSLATTVGQGSATSGYWLGNTGLFGSYKLIAAPKSTELERAWGSYGTARGTISTTNGLANTTTLFGFGSAAHPAAYYCRTLTTGGYNTWYLPAKNELNTLYSNKSATPFATANSFVGSNYWSSTEYDGYTTWYQTMVGTGGQYGDGGKSNFKSFRAVRAAGTLAIGAGNDTQGYYLGTAGDGTSKMIVAPKSTEVSRTWGAYALRGTNSTKDGLSNTNTLASYGSTAHPAAYYCKTLTTGGYNTWYLPAKDELFTLYSNKSAAPFSTANGFGSSYWSSTEYNANGAWYVLLSNGGSGNGNGKISSIGVRAVRRV